MAIPQFFIEGLDLYFSIESQLGILLLLNICYKDNGLTYGYVSRLTYLQITSSIADFVSENFRHQMHCIIVLAAKCIQQRHYPRTV
ncbi:hypothetical protein BLOT_001141 [Blomia tropicalis]|nr:hypothetical protein BLOT_001141 [Blomia tropicalis]